MEIVGGDRRSQTCKPAHLVQANDGQRDGPGKQDQGLHKIGVNHGGEAARDRIDSRRHNQDDRGGQWAPAHHALQHDGSRVQMHRDLRKDVRDDGDACEIGRTVAIEAPF